SLPVLNVPSGFIRFLFLLILSISSFFAIVELYCLLIPLFFLNNDNSSDGGIGVFESGSGPYCGSCCCELVVVGCEVDVDCCELVFPIKGCCD
ncbi:MAG: hypothetical protein EBT20_16430, partial [Alphaproteobacteria bacterium]|nr:hypothetical protein [Alphaproteobacteria bacterium]